MRGVLLFVALGLAACRPGHPARPTSPPFENPGGMWLPQQLPEQAATLKSLGLSIDPAALGDPLSYPLGSVVSLGGCSASFVSADGLIVTNHHCAIGALQYNSTPARNLIEGGFLAPTRAAELWNGPTSRVYVTQRLRDVTAAVRAGLEELGSDRERYDTIEARTKAAVAACERDRPDVRCAVASTFGGATYTLVEQLEIRDVRLVYAPHGQIGNYGGEIDNWRWPRHAGDFAFFRAYVGPDGKGADHGQHNVPYHPPQHLKLASTALKPGDFVMVAGYPGHTSRLSTASEVAQSVSWQYPHTIERAEIYMAALEALGKADPNLTIKTGPSIRYLSNGLLKARGIMDGLLKGGLLSSKQKTDADLRAWIAGDPDRRARYGDLFARLAALDAERIKLREREAAWGETLQFSRLLGAAMTIVRMADERGKPDDARVPAFQQRNWPRIKQAQVQMQKTYDRAIDRPLLKLALQRAARLPPVDRPIIGLLLGASEPTAAHVDRAVDDLYGATDLEREEARVRLLEATPAELHASTDRLVQLATALLPFQKQLEDTKKALEGALVLLRPRYIAALREFSPRPLAPDANGTLRVTYGTVRAYQPSPDAPALRPFTVLTEVVTRHTGHDPFDCPAKLRDAVRQRRLGSYVDADLGDVPVDFLSDVDITSGNSGSATLNARGELVGLAFDGNIEGVASDWLFMPAVARTIHVDARYMLWVMDIVDGAQDLLREMRAHVP
ncbi:MAG TPA: S46 family peptidase [Polyangia bacterium]|jgi:hypothetical protein|nr:S46 family peptidase [Polyangia bacterium]